MDYDLWIRIAREFKVGYIPEFLACLRIHPGAKTTAQAVATYREDLRLIKKYYGRVGGAMVYGYAYNMVKSRQGRESSKKLIPFLRIFTRFIIEYVKINKGLPLRELAGMDMKAIRGVINKI